MGWVGHGAPAAREVSIVTAAGNSLLLVTHAASGDYFCVAQATVQTERAPGRHSPTSTPR